MKTPALFDFQINGFAGVDFQRPRITPAQLRHAVDSLRAHGLAAFFLTLITDTLDRLAAQLHLIETHRAADPRLARAIPGYHLEGPWLNPQPGYRGAHPPAHMLPPRIADFDRLQNAARGNIRLVTLAPELPGAPAFISALARRRVHISLGHTNATNAQIDTAIRAGARFCTHLGNATPPQLPRHDNIIQRLLARDELTACLIPDGIHLPPFVLKNLFRAKPPGKVLFTTDAMSAAAAPPGRYTLGSLKITIGPDTIARAPHGGFAGSTLTPDEALYRTARYLALAPPEALRLWTTAPAAAFGINLK